MDARILDFDEGSFDTIIDKGTLDCVLVKKKIIDTFETILHLLIIYKFSFAPKKIYKILIIWLFYFENSIFFQDF